MYILSWVELLFVVVSGLSWDRLLYMWVILGDFLGVICILRCILMVVILIWCVLWRIVVFMCEIVLWFYWIMLVWSRNGVLGSRCL